ncbi:hypothetical protein [Phormidium tenue]|uniref:Uncharacterized protein n=1 Tax=Phormidium tenue FACHB-1050 TaxID=2692857 RepID=A0ABR8CDV6_9CYAN|nr:hypothetical protein [Phormidium tenue]MBD2318791.1 hypothetical protein [Phormidium tenue FACHB-1050]
MKVFNFKSALAMLTFSAMSLFFQAPTQAQVNKQLLSDVIKSCQRDMSIDYFKRMGILVRKLNTEPSSRTQKVCIQYRYYYGSVIEQFPWLPDSGEIVPGYSASVALSASTYLYNEWGVATEVATEEQILKCVTSKVFNGGNECSWTRFRRYYDYRNSAQPDDFLPLVCPKCVVAHDDASNSELNRGFINWFLSLDKSKRRDVVSLLSSSDILYNLAKKKRMAAESYEDALTKIEQDEKAQRRRNLLGQ